MDHGPTHVWEDMALGGLGHLTRRAMACRCRLLAVIHVEEVGLYAKHHYDATDTDHHELSSAQPVDHEDGGDGREKVDRSHSDLSPHAGCLVEASFPKNLGTEIHIGIDPSRLLEELEEEAQ